MTDHSVCGQKKKKETLDVNNCRLFHPEVFTPHLLNSLFDRKNLGENSRESNNSNTESSIINITTLIMVGCGFHQNTTSTSTPLHAWLLGLRWRTMGFTLEKELFWAFLLIIHDFVWIFSAITVIYVTQRRKNSPWKQAGVDFKSRRVWRRWTLMAEVKHIPVLLLSVCAQRASPATEENCRWLFPNAFQRAKWKTISTIYVSALLFSLLPDTMRFIYTLILKEKTKKKHNRKAET